MTRPIKVTSEQSAALRVVLVSMPFMETHRPSIQLGLLKALTAGCGFPVRTLHANLDFAVRIGLDYYDLLCEHRGPMVGEWLFSIEAFPDTAPDRDAHMIDDLAGGLRLSFIEAIAFHAKNLKLK